MSTETLKPTGTAAGAAGNAGGNSSFLGSTLSCEITVKCAGSVPDERERTDKANKVVAIWGGVVAIFMLCKALVVLHEKGWKAVMSHFRARELDR